MSIRIGLVLFIQIIRRSSCLKYLLPYPNQYLIDGVSGISSADSLNSSTITLDISNCIVSPSMSCSILITWKKEIILSRMAF